MLKRRKGEIATLLTLGLIILGGVLAIGSSVFLSKNKQTTSSRAASCSEGTLQAGTSYYQCEANCGKTASGICPNYIHNSLDASCAQCNGLPTSAPNCLTIGASCSSGGTKCCTGTCVTSSSPPAGYCPSSTSTSSPTVTPIPNNGSGCGSGGIYNCPADPISKKNCSTTKGYAFGCCVNDNPSNMCSGGVRWRWYGCTGQPCENTKINNTGIEGDGELHACPDYYTTDKCYGGGSTTPPEITPVCFKRDCYQNAKKMGIMYYYDTNTKSYYKDNSNNNHCSGTSFTSELDVCKTSPAIVPSDTPANEETSIPPLLPQVGGNNQECINRFQTPYAYCGNYFGSTFSCTKTDNIGGKILKYIKYNHVCGIGALNKDLFCCVREDANSAPGTGNQNLPTPVTGDTGNKICENILKTDKTYCQFLTGCFKQEAVGGKTVDYIETTARCDHDTLERYCCIREDTCTTCHTISVTNTSTSQSIITDNNEEGILITILDQGQSFVKNK